MKKEKLKSNVKEEKGITLIALVITVVVMLILAGVVISTIINDEGLFSKTNKSVVLNEKSNIEECIRVAEMYLEIDKIYDSKINIEDLIDILKEISENIEKNYTVNIIDDNNAELINEKLKILVDLTIDANNSIHSNVIIYDDINNYSRVKIDYVLNKYIEDYMFRKQLQKDVMNIRVKTSDNFIKKTIEAILGFYDSYEAGYTRNIYFARWI